LSVLENSIVLEIFPARENIQDIYPYLLSALHEYAARSLMRESVFICG